MALKVKAPVHPGAKIDEQHSLQNWTGLQYQTKLGLNDDLYLFVKPIN